MSHGAAPGEVGSPIPLGAVVKGKGPLLDPPVLPLQLPLTIQLQGSHEERWEATFHDVSVVKNSAVEFKGKAGASGAYLEPWHLSMDGVPVRR